MLMLAAPPGEAWFHVWTSMAGALLAIGGLYAIKWVGKWMRSGR